MKNKNITFSMPDELIGTLHSVVGRRGLSQFVAKAIKKALEERMSELKRAYAAANNDPDRLKTISDWESLEAEGWDE